MRRLQDRPLAPETGGRGRQPPPPPSGDEGHAEERGIVHGACAGRVACQATDGRGVRMSAASDAVSIGSVGGVGRQIVDAPLGTAFGSSRKRRSWTQRLPLLFGMQGGVANRGLQLLGDLGVTRQSAWEHYRGEPPG